MSLATRLQYILPHHLLSWVVRKATRWTWAPWKNFLISTVVRRYRVDLHEAEQPNPLAYPHFNAFFTRALKPGVRPITQQPQAVACPADGRISQAGDITDGRILQAKGQTFTCAELLGEDDAAAAYTHGRFVTIYLSPRDYHRVHMPLDGRLQKTVHVPGRLFSVAPLAVHEIPRLFARNERLACHFQGTHGPFAVVMVGAMLVSGVQTVWGGEIIPPYGRDIRRTNHDDASIALRRGDEMARFNMGSTVIVLLPECAALAHDLDPQQEVHMGMRLGTLHSSLRGQPEIA